MRAVRSHPGDSAQGGHDGPHAYPGAGMDPLPSPLAYVRCRVPWEGVCAQTYLCVCVYNAASQVGFDVRQQRSQSRVRLLCFVVALHQVCMQPHANAFLALRPNVKDL